MNNQWKVISISLFAGILIGWCSGFTASHMGMHEWKSGKMLEKFSGELQLSSDQKEKVGKILEATREKISALRNEVHPRFEAIRSASKADIRVLLTADQQVKFDKLEAKWESRWQKKRTQWSEK